MSSIPNEKKGMIYPAMSKLNARIPNRYMLVDVVARRARQIAETAEETGYDVKSLRFLTTIICTPGYCEERIHIYFAELADGQHAQDQDPDENVFPVVLSEAEVEEGIRNGTIFDSKTLSAWACYRLMK